MTSFLIAKGIGIGASAWLAGNIASISQITVPALQPSIANINLNPTKSVQQWKIVYENGKAGNPPVAATAAAAFFYLAWVSKNAGLANRAIACASSALLTVAIVPFTFAAMSSTNNKLLAHAAWAEEQTKSTTGKLEDSNIEGLIQKWGQLNLIRSVFPLIGCAIALAVL